jgi:hypothetical protein
MSKQPVYNVSQLPSSIEKKVVSYNGECNVNGISDYALTLDLTDKGNPKLTGESLFYDEDEGDWDGKAITLEQCLDIANTEILVVPIAGQMIPVMKFFQK